MKLLESIFCSKHPNGIIQGLAGKEMACPTKDKQRKVGHLIKLGALSRKAVGRKVLTYRMGELSLRASNACLALRCT